MLFSFHLSKTGMEVNFAQLVVHVHVHGINVNKYSHVNLRVDCEKIFMMRSILYMVHTSTCSYVHVHNDKCPHSVLVLSVLMILRYLLLIKVVLPMHM